jgi:hypothetical protein
MILLPAPMGCVALALGILFPLLMFGCAQIKSIRGSGVRFAAGCVTIAALFLALAIVMPGPRDPADVFGGLLFLIAAMLFWHVVWSLLAFGFTLTLLTALVQTDQPLTRSEWILAYMQGADLKKFAWNRLQLLLGTGMARTDQQKIVATPFGAAVATMIRSTRFLFGIR